MGFQGPKASTLQGRSNGLSKRMPWMAILELVTRQGEEWRRKCYMTCRTVFGSWLRIYLTKGWDTTGRIFSWPANSGEVQPRRFNAEFSAPCAQWTSWAAGVNLPSQAVSFKKSFIRRCSGWAPFQLGEWPPTLGWESWSLKHIALSCTGYLYGLE